MGIYRRHQVLYVIVRKCYYTLPPRQHSAYVCTCVSTDIWGITLHYNVSSRWAFVNQTGPDNLMGPPWHTQPVTDGTAIMWLYLSYSSSSVSAASTLFHYYLFAKWQRQTARSLMHCFTPHMTPRAAPSRDWKELKDADHSLLLSQARQGDGWQVGQPEHETSACVGCWCSKTEE